MVLVNNLKIKNLLKNLLHSFIKIVSIKIIFYYLIKNLINSKKIFYKLKNILFIFIYFLFIKNKIIKTLTI